MLYDIYKFFACAAQKLEISAVLQFFISAIIISEL